MKDSNSVKCPRCGRPIPAGVTDRLCPACLMSGALGVSGNATIPMAPIRAAGAPDPALFRGDLGGYRVLGLLGRGGMGTVYEAEQLANGRRVALKVLDQQLDSPDLRQRFLREGRLAAGVNHPNSLYVFGSEEIEGVPIITMEIAGSGTLKDKLKQHGALPVAEAVDSILDVIAGLEAAYEAGVLHRDVKPSNCFLTPEGTVKIGDFGISVSTLAREDSFATASGVMVGTPAYASPEQLRGDDLDVRADIYSVGATLYTLLTDRAPFEGDNAVQVVANAVNQKPKPVSELREGLPPGLDRVVNRCLAKEPEGRYGNYAELRNALLPFGSQEAKPASMKVRVLAGWMDYLAAFAIPYVTLMLSVGSVAFHVQPLIERSLFSARYYLIFLAVGFAYFSITEGIWGAGLGKRLVGLCVVRGNGRVPGPVRALVRILIPIGCIELLRVPFLLATISLTDLNQWTPTDTLLYIGVSNVCPWLAVLLTLTARPGNGHATVWDLVTGTRVVFRPKGAIRATLKPFTPEAAPSSGARWLGPYQVSRALVPGAWGIAFDPVLRRQVWLLRQEASGVSLPRHSVSRVGRLRWLQTVQADDEIWDAFEAPSGMPYCALIQDGKHLPWTTLRLWLHDLASECWAATGDRTLPSALSLDHVWISRTGHAVLLDQPWPGVGRPAERIPVGDLAGQQRFLNAVAAGVDSDTLPLHARPVLQNLARGTFEKLSFLTGTLRGLLDQPAEVSRRIRAGSIFMLPVYVWFLVFIGYYSGGHRDADTVWNSGAGIALATALVVLGVIAAVQLLELPFRTTASFSIFRLAVVNRKGERASRLQLLARWAFVWFPLIIPVGLLILWNRSISGIHFVPALTLLLAWIGVAIFGVVHPYRGLPDRFAGTRVVRR